MSAIVVVFMLFSLGKLHAEYEREQASALKFHPEGRHMLSVQHLSKEGIAGSKASHQKLFPVETEEETHYSQYQQGSDFVPKRKFQLRNDSRPPVSSKTEETDPGDGSDVVNLEDQDEGDDLNAFEELDGFNYVAHKEKEEAEKSNIKHIRFDDQNNVLMVDSNHVNEILPGNGMKFKTGQIGNAIQNVAARSDRLARHVRPEKSFANQDDFDDEEKIPVESIRKHKPVLPNLPPEDTAHVQDINIYPEQSDTFVRAKDKHRSRWTGARKFNLKSVTITNNIHTHKPTQAPLLQSADSKLGAKDKSFKEYPFKAHKSFDDLYKADVFMFNKAKDINNQIEETNNLLSNTANFDHINNIGPYIQQQNIVQKDPSREQHYPASIPKKRRKKKRKLSRRTIRSLNDTSVVPSQDIAPPSGVNHNQSALSLTQQPSVLNIYMKPNGRLGNQMFEIASLYGIASKAGRNPYMSQYSDIYQIFSLANKTVATGEASDDLGILFEEKPGVFNQDLFSLPPTDLIICCYFQSWKYFEGLDGDIQKMFRFRGRIRKLANGILAKAKGAYLTHLTDQINQYETSHKLTYVGVHVRRGDVLDEHHIRRGYRPAPFTYFHKAMDYYRRHFPNTLFIVTGDDITWCKAKLGSSDVFIVEGQHEAVDLAVLSMTNHTVISVGTFSWWAGWLAGGQVIYYKNWPKPASDVDKLYNRQDYFPPKWRPMGD